MNKANKITYSRFLFGIIMMIAAFLSNFNVFMLAYIIALFTDILDGYIARKLKIVTKFGKKLDIIADNFIMVCLLFGLFLLKPEIIELYRYFLFIFVYYLCIQAISLVYSKQLIFARTYIARLAAVLFPISIVVYLFFNNKILIILYCITMIFSLTEKILLQMTKSKKKAPTLIPSKQKKPKKQNPEN